MIYSKLELFWSGELYLCDIYQNPIGEINVKFSSRSYDKQFLIENHDRFARNAIYKYN